MRAPKLVTRPAMTRRSRRFLSTSVLGVVLFFSISAALVGSTVYTNPTDFDAATAELGVPTVISFDELDASPVNDTIEGREPFDGGYYADQGVVFSNPNGYPLYITPGGLFWNPSNSLSVARFPYDPYFPYTWHEDDDLVINFDPPCIAVGFTLVDNYSQGPEEYIQFMDSGGDVVEQVGLPPNLTQYRAFVGIVSTDSPIKTINVVEDPDDADDVNYDDFICYPAVIKVDIDIKPGSYPNSINCSNVNEVIAVAVLTTEEFDATTVDHTTVTFEGASEIHTNQAGHPTRHEEDADGDGDIDLVFHFLLGDTALRCDSTVGTISGETFDGWTIEGTDEVRMVSSVCRPSLRSPKEGATLDNGRTDTQDDVVWDFDWSECRGAEAYHLYVKHPDADFAVIDAYGISSSSYRYVGRGAYVIDANRFGWTWKVRAMVDGQWGAWSKIGTFDVESVNTDPPQAQ